MYSGQEFKFPVTSLSMTIEQLKKNIRKQFSSKFGECEEDWEFLQIYVNYETAADDQKVMDLVTKISFVSKL
jgi:hypothetical protein